MNVIHAHVSYPGGFIASILAEEFGVPFVLTEHMSPFPLREFTRAGRPMPQVERAFRSASAIVAVSPSLASRIASFGYAEPQVIPNVVDERSFRPMASTSRKTVFLTVCRMSNQKGVDTLLDAIALWNPSPDLYEFRICGEGPALSDLKTQAHSLGLNDRVRWLPAVSRRDAPYLFADCDIFVMSSRHETFGVVFAEAIACGKPVIGTRCGGPESIINRKNGVLAEVGDVVSLAAALQDTSARLPEFDADEIRTDFLRRFSRAPIARQLSDLYGRVVTAF